MKKSGKTLGKAFIILIVLILLDQVTKLLAVRFLAGSPGIALWEGVMELQYVENHGMAFGLLQNHQGLFLISTVLVMLTVSWLYLFRIPDVRRFYPLNMTAVLVLAGAAGNMIDRVRQSYVVDFLYFRLIDFPVFNVADCYVSVAAVLLILLLLFYYKEEELEGIL